MKGALLNYENTFYLDGAALSGIISFDGSYNLTTQPINVIGKGYLKQVLAEVPSANISLSRFLVNSDPILQLTGDGYNYLAASCSGGIVYNGKSFGFGTGYLNSFGINCSVGNIPQIQSTFDVYGNIGSGINTSGNAVAGSVFVPQVKNILVTCNQSTTNRVKEFTIDYKCPKIPIYALSETSAEVPIEVHNQFPIEVISSFTIDVDDYETRRSFDILSNSNLNSLSVSIRGAVLNDIVLAGHDEIDILTWDDQQILLYSQEVDSTPVFYFSTDEAIIISEQVSATADDVLGVKLTYKSYLN